MRILGIDPGSRVTGFGIIDKQQQHNHFVTCGVIRVNATAMPQRLLEIHQGLTEVIVQHHPTVLAIEEVFVAYNVASALKLGQARGAALVACAAQGIPVYEYASTRVKQAVVGQGHADKTQVQHMVKVLLNLSGSPQSDAADALAVALCHAHSANDTLAYL